MGSGGPSNTTSTSTSSLPGYVKYWGQQLLNTAGPYYLDNLQMPASLNQQTAGFNPTQNAAFGDIAGQTGGAMGLANTGGGFLQSLLGGNPNAAVAPYLSGAEKALSGVQGSLGGVQGTLGGVNRALSSLTPGSYTGTTPQSNAYINAQLSGKYLNPETNPWLKGTYNEAAKDVTTNYQNAVAPSLMAEGEMAAGGGPGALASGSGFNQQQWINQYGLGQNLGNLATNIYGGAYEQGVQNQLSAAGMANEAAQAGAQENISSALGAANAELGAGNLELGAGNLGLGVASGQLGAAGIAQGGIAHQLEALGLLPQTLQSGYAPANQLLASGTMQQQQQQTQLSTAFQNALRAATYGGGQLSGLAGLLGPAGGGAGTTITTQPNYGGTK
jgi:hypothetical protein